MFPWSHPPCLSFLTAVRDPWASRGKGVIKTSHPGLSAPKSPPSACCLSVVWVFVWLYPLLQGASILRAEQCIDLHGIPGYLQMKIEKCRGSISPAPPVSKLFMYSRKSQRLMCGGGLCVRCFIVYPWVLDRIFGSCVPEQGFWQGDTWLAREENLREKGLQKV